MMMRMLLGIGVVGLALVVSTVAGCSDRREAGMPQVRAARDADAGREMPTVGYIECRGRLYKIDDLLDADYRAKSKDPFVRDFRPDTVYADVSVEHPPYGRR